VSRAGSRSSAVGSASVTSGLRLARVPIGIANATRPSVALSRSVSTATTACSCSLNTAPPLNPRCTGSAESTSSCTHSSPTVQRLDAAQRAGRLDAELDRLRRIPLLVCDEVGYIPFEPEAAALFYALVASRYERASMIVSSNKPFSAWAEIFGDAVAVAAMVDRLVHHAEIINLNGDSYRLKGRRKDTDQTQ